MQQYADPSVRAAKQVVELPGTCRIGAGGHRRAFGVFVRDPVFPVGCRVGHASQAPIDAPMVEEPEMILLHAFIKKTQQTDPTNIEMATKRLKEWKNGQNN